MATTAAADDNDPFAHVNDPSPEPNIPSAEIQPEEEPDEDEDDDDGMGMSEEQAQAYEDSLPPTALDLDATRRPRGHAVRPVEHSIGPQPEGTNVWVEGEEVLKVSGIVVEPEEEDESDEGKTPSQDVFTPSPEQRS